MARVRVYNKQTGQWGTVSEQFANSPKYSTTGPQAQAPQQSGGFLTNLIGSLISPFKRTAQRGVGAVQEVGLNRAGRTDEAEALMQEAQKQMMAGNMSPDVLKMLDTAEQLSKTGARGTVASRNQPQLTDTLQIAKDSAAMLSWGVPATKALGLGKVGTRALGGAAGGFGYSPEKSIEGLLGSTALGAGTSVAAGALFDKLFPSTEKISTIAPDDELGKVSPGTSMQRSAQVKMIGRKGLATNDGVKLVDQLDDAGITIGKDVKNAPQLWEASTKLLKESSDEVQSGLQQLSQQGVKIDTGQVFDALDDKISKQGLTSTKAAMEKVKQELIESIGGEGAAVNPDLFYRIKYNAGGKGKWGVFTGISGDEASAWETVYKAMNQQLDDTLKRAGVETLRQSNKNIATAMKAMDWSSKASEAVPSSPWGFYETVSLGTGLSYGGLPGAAGNIALNKILTNPMYQYKAGGLLNKLGSQGAQTAPTGIRSAIGSLSGAAPALPGALTQAGRQPESQSTQPMSGMQQPMGQQQQPTDILSMLGLDAQSLMLLSALPAKEQNKILTDLIGEQITGDGGEGDVGLISDAAARAYQKLSTSDIKTGKIGGPLEALKASWGAGGDQPTLEFNVLVDNIYSAIAKARGGTVLSDAERKLLAKYLPQTGDSRQELETKLRAIMENPELVVYK